MKINKSNKTRSDCFYTILKTPVGDLRLVASDRGLVAILWNKTSRQIVDFCDAKKISNHSTSFAHSAQHAHKILIQTQKQLSEYFAHTRKTFDIPLELSGTDFQKRVWVVLQKIPFGTTVSYADIAREIKKPKAVRAVGNANNRNPICIVAGCHRVVGSSGALTGYAGGLAVKAKLLQHEGIRIPLDGVI